MIKCRNHWIKWSSDLFQNDHSRSPWLHDCVCVCVHVINYDRVEFAALAWEIHRNTITLHSVDSACLFSCCLNAHSTYAMPKLAVSATNSWGCLWQACLPPRCWRWTMELCRGSLGPSSTWWAAVLADTAGRWYVGRSLSVPGMLLWKRWGNIFLKMQIMTE